MTTTEAIERGITPQQYADKKGVCLATAYQHIWQGKVQAEKVLDRWLIIEPEEATSVR